MSYFSGKDGAVYMKVDTAWKKVAKAVNIQLTSSQSSLDTTTLEDTDRTVVAGVRSMTGSCRILYYQETKGNNTTNRASQLINKLIKPSTKNTEPGIAADPEEVLLRFAVNDGSNAAGDTPGRFTEINTVLTSASISMGVGEIFAADINFDVIGAPQSTSI